MSQRTALIDGDEVVYHSLLRANQQVCWHDNVWTNYCDHAEAMLAAHRVIEKVIKNHRFDQAILAFSDPSHRYFRHTVNPNYKGNRDVLGLPLPGKDEFIERLRRAYPGDWKPGLEADDVLGILATCGTIHGEVVIVSQDKDLHTIPGRWIKGLHCEDELVISEEEADAYFLEQTLTGDRVDGYSGCPGIGPAKALKVLKDWEKNGHKNQWEAIVAAYEKAGLSADDALMNARCARILRACDYDLSKGEVILWTPDSKDPA